MPQATVSLEPQKFDLKSCKDGWVLLQPLPYGKVIQRRSMMKMQVEAQRGKNKSLAGELALADEAFTRFDFQHCLIDHNLEGPDGKKLDLQSGRDFHRLAPKVGQEIEDLMAELNDLGESDEDEVEDFDSGSEEQ